MRGANSRGVESPALAGLSMSSPEAVESRRRYSTKSGRTRAGVSAQRAEVYLPEQAAEGSDERRGLRARAAASVASLLAIVGLPLS